MHREVLKALITLLLLCDALLSGESPSSASDVDNLNNPAGVDKATLSKGISSSRATGSHVIPAKSRPNFVRLLNYVRIF